MFLNFLTIWDARLLVDAAKSICSKSVLLKPLSFFWGGGGKTELASWQFCSDHVLGEGSEEGKM